MQQVVVGLEAGVSVGEDGVAFGPLAAGEVAAGHPFLARNLYVPAVTCRLMLWCRDWRYKRVALPRAPGSAAAEAALAGVAGTCKQTHQAQVFTAANFGLLADATLKISFLLRDDDLIKQVGQKCNSNDTRLCCLTCWRSQVITPMHSGALIIRQMTACASASILCLQVYGPETAAHPERVFDGTVAPPPELQMLYNAIKRHL
jgi:hypothetical protein